MNRSGLVLAVVGLAFGGCQATNPRIAEHAAAFAELDPSTQRKIRAGVVEPGYTPDMVYMALGRPAEVTGDGRGGIVWLYRVEPVLPTNETILSGYRRRVVYDPVKRSDDVIVEPIDEKAFPNLVPHTLRLTFQAGHLVTMDRAVRRSSGGAQPTPGTLRSE